MKLALKALEPNRYYNPTLVLPKDTQVVPISSAPRKFKVGDCIRPIKGEEIKYKLTGQISDAFVQPPGAFTIADINGEWFRAKNSDRWYKGAFELVDVQGRPIKPDPDLIAKHLAPTVKKCVVTDCTFPSLNISKLCEYCKGIYDEDGEVMTSTSAPAQFQVGDKVEAIRKTKAYPYANTFEPASSVQPGYRGIVIDKSSMYEGRIKFAKYWYNAKDFKLIKKTAVG